MAPYYEDDNNHPHEMPDADSFKNYDNYSNAEVLLPQDGEHLQATRVLKRSLDSVGNSKGTININPLLDTRIYNVIFPDGAVRQYSTNSIAKSMYIQVDEDGNTITLLDSIIDHRSDKSTIRIADSNNKTKFTTKG